MEEVHPELRVLHSEIEARAAATVAAHPSFPCRKGCDHCCRHLAALPMLTPPEEELLREGIASLAPEAQSAIAARFAALGPSPARPVVCPLLDPATGACLVYAHRPIACRTYGFYVERGQGLYCHMIEAEVSSGALRDVIWGNQASVEARAASLGPVCAIKFS